MMSHVDGVEDDDDDDDDVRVSKFSSVSVTTCWVRSRGLLFSVVVVGVDVVVVAASVAVEQSVVVVDGSREHVGSCCSSSSSSTSSEAFAIRVVVVVVAVVGCATAVCKCISIRRSVNNMDAHNVSAVVIILRRFIILGMLLLWDGLDVGGAIILCGD